MGADHRSDESHSNQTYVRFRVDNRAEVVLPIEQTFDRTDVRLDVWPVENSVTCTVRPVGHCSSQFSEESKTEGTVRAMAAITIAPKWHAESFDRSASRQRTPRQAVRRSTGSSVARTRALAVGILAAAALAVLSLLPGSADASNPTMGESAPRLVTTVHYGDSLWSIAQRTMPGDVRANVERLASANRLSQRELQVGQQLVIPR